MSFEGMGSLAVAAAADSCSYPRCPLLAVAVLSAGTNSGATPNAFGIPRGVGCRRWLKTPLTGRLIHVNCPQGCQRSIASGSGQLGGKWQLAVSTAPGALCRLYPRVRAFYEILMQVDLSLRFSQ